MSKNLLLETKSVLKELQHLRSVVENSSTSLKKYEDLILKPSKKAGSSRVYYYVKSKGASRRKYLDRNSKDVVNLIKEAKYIHKLLEIVDRDIDLLEAVERDFVLPEHEVINSLLPAVYKNPDLKTIRYSSPDAIAWKERMEAKKAKYKPNKPEDLIHPAADGTMMRSKSESLIANHLLSLGIVFVYELPYIHHGERRDPDFTILSPVDNKTVIIIEHQGMMYDEGYQTKFIKMLLFYLQTPLVPNKNLFLTFNHKNGSTDLRQIDSILHTAFGFTK